MTEDEEIEVPNTREKQNCQEPQGGIRVRMSKIEAPCKNRNRIRKLSESMPGYKSTKVTSHTESSLGQES
jgi:hypothetical protein